MGSTSIEAPRPAGRIVARPTLARVPIALGVLVAGCVLLHLYWVSRFRWGFPTEWDESGYIAIAVRDTQALQDGGPISLLRMVEGQPVQAPLVPLLTVPFHLLFGTGVDQSLLLVPIFGAALLVATYGIARRLMPPPWALLAVAVVAAAPVVTDYTRLYHFSVPAAALMTGAVWALLRSDLLRVRRFAVAAGVLVGLMVLARTMTLSYLPGIALAAAAQLIAPGPDRRRRAVNLGLGALAAVVVAASWYAHNWRGVYDWLVGIGYGAESDRFGDEGSILSPAAWTSELETLLEELYLPLALALGLALATAGAFALALARAGGRGGWGTRRKWLASPGLPLALIVLGGYLALISSRDNEGTAFGLPLLPLLVVLTVGATARLPRRAPRLAIAAALVAVSAGNVAMKSGLFPALVGPRSAELAGIGPVPVIDGHGILHGELAATGYDVSATEPPAPFHRRWLSFERDLVNRIAHHARRLGTAPSGYLGARHLVLTNTSLRLAATLERQEAGVGWLKPYPDREQAYRRTLREADASFLLVLESPATGAAGVTPVKAEDAAASLGFRLVETFRLPDGRPARLWWLASESRGDRARARPPL